MLSKSGSIYPFLYHKLSFNPSLTHSLTLSLSKMYNLIKRRAKILLTLLPISALVFVILLSSTTHLKNNPKTSKTNPNLHFHTHKHIHYIAHSTCQGTLYPQLCISTLSTFQDLTTKSSIQHIIASLLNHTISEVKSTSSTCTGIRNKLRKKLAPLDKRALEDCLELFDNTLDVFKTAISDLSSKKLTLKKKKKQFHDLQTLLSGAMTNQYTCLDGFAYSKTNIRDGIQSRVYNISHHVSNSLAMLKKIPTTTTTSEDEDEIFPEYGHMKNGFPTWISDKDRRLLQTSSNETKYDLKVAQDGSGDYTTIGEALAAAPNSSTTRFVIYIEAGTYYEYLEVISRKRMLMFVGDGIGKTIIKGDRNFVDGWTTFGSSTVAVGGTNFLMKGITVENYAGPSKHQAVALRSSADFSAFYQCSFIGYQDTLYVHTFRQFYRECDVYGTIDFIFGNAAVVLQLCNLYARKPNERQKNAITAQGRDDQNQNTGISILNCKVAADADLIPVQSSFPTYLGRPWKDYSRTVFMLSNLGDLIDPVGWLEWSADTEPRLSTLYYGEYQNRGLGSNTSARVTWPGYRVITNITEASQFIVGSFIQGSDWLDETDFPYYLNLAA